MSAGLGVLLCLVLWLAALAGMGWMARRDLQDGKQQEKREGGK